MDYYIKVKGTPVTVSEEVYKAYCQGERNERYFRESDIRNRTFFYDALDTEELKGSDMFWDPSAESVEEAAEKRWLLEKLRQAISQLAPDERDMLYRLYLRGDSLRAFSKDMGIPLSTAHARHRRLLEKLKKNLEP